MFSSPPISLPKKGNSNYKLDSISNGCFLLKTQLIIFLWMEVMYPCSINLLIYHNQVIIIVDLYYSAFWFTVLYSTGMNEYFSLPTRPYYFLAKLHLEIVNILYYAMFVDSYSVSKQIFHKLIQSNYVRKSLY